MRRLRIVGWVLVLCLMFGLSATMTLGQAVYGSIAGTVSDAQGAAVAGAKVTITSLEKGNAEETTTNESGNYTVTRLIPGNYHVRIEGTGFKAYDVASVAVGVDVVVHLDAALEVGA